MKLKIERIENAGILEKERIVLRVLTDDEIGRYIILKTKKMGGTAVSSNPSAVFWFSDKKVAKDDWVVVYTKTGVNSSAVSDTGNFTHFFYWDKNLPMWNNPDDAIVLIHSDGWTFKDSK